MPEFWLSVDYVGFNRVFITGRMPGDEDFELELNQKQKDMHIDFISKQQEALQQFLMNKDFLDAN